MKAKSSSRRLVFIGAASVALAITVSARAQRKKPIPDFQIRCGDEARTIAAKFEAFVAANRACRVDADCGVARGYCPLPCGVVLARAKVAEAEKLGMELLGSIGKDCRCKYKCGPPTRVACRDGVCVEDLVTPAKADGRTAPDR